MKIGDYVRTKYGIAKIVGISCGEDLMFDNDNIFDEDEKNIYRYDRPSMYSNWSKDNIIKSSPNIIDLIEVGDYVNGNKVIEHAYQHGRLFVTNLYIGGKGFTTTEDYSWELTKDNEDMIESIVTKEQFERMEYKI